MKMKFGAIVVDGRGKIGGHVASKNRAGAYMRTKVTPVNPNTSFQAAARSRLTNFAQAWRGLTAAQRLAWNSAVADFKKTNIFGDLNSPSGFNLYQRLNNNLAIIGEAAITVPPLPEAVGYMATLSLTASEGTGAVTISFTPAIPATAKVKLFATGPVSAGKSFVKSQYRLIDVLVTGDTSPHVATAEYNAKFGSVGVAGQKVFIKAVLVDLDTGIEGIASSASVIVGA